MRRERLCLVGFFLVVVLLVSPVAAESAVISFDCDDFDGWASVSSYLTAAGGYYTRVPSGGSPLEGAMFYLPEGSFDGDFSLTVSASGGYSPGDVYVFLSNGVWFGWAVSSSSGAYEISYSGEGGGFYQSSLSYPYSESATVSRVGDEIVISVGSFTKTFPFDSDPVNSTYLEVQFYKYSAYSFPSTTRITSMTFTYEVDDFLEPCNIRVYDSETRLPLSGSWRLIVLDGHGGDRLFDASVSGNSTTVYLPKTSIFRSHWLHVEMDGYEQIPAQLLIAVPSGGRDVDVWLTPVSGTAGDNTSIVTFTVTDIANGAPLRSALVNVGVAAKYTGVNGTAWFELPENATYQWVVSTFEHWPIGGNFTLGADDLSIDVSLTRKTSELPRPPLPELPNFPYISPSLDPSGFRMHILSVPILGGIASPVLDFMDSLALGLDDAVSPILDIMSEPLNGFVDILSVVCSNLVGLVDTYTGLAGVLLSCVGRLLSAFPDIVLGLLSYELVLDLVYLVLRGGL